MVAWESLYALYVCASMCLHLCSCPCVDTDADGGFWKTEDEPDEFWTLSLGCEYFEFVTHWLYTHAYRQIPLLFDKYNLKTSCL